MITRLSSGARKERARKRPWRIEEGWWSDRPDIREYWDVELERGGVYRVFRGGATEWFVDARYEM